MWFTSFLIEKGDNVINNWIVIVESVIVFNISAIYWIDAVYSMGDPESPKVRKY